MAALTANLEKVARATNMALPGAALAFLTLGSKVSFDFHFGSVAFLLASALNVYYRHGQARRALLRDFGVIAQGRYVVESIGPELRQYLFATDMEEKSFNRVERSEVYRKAKGGDSSAAFSSQRNLGESGVQLLHSAYPRNTDEVRDFELTFGTRSDCKAAYSTRRPAMISAMSYGALSSLAIHALARGGRAAGIVMNTGEGGYPKHHLKEGCDPIFQMGTAKFGMRKEDGTLDDARLATLAGEAEIKMIEIKLSQAPSRGRGGYCRRRKSPRKSPSCEACCKVETSSRRRVTQSAKTPPQRWHSSDGYRK